MSGGGRSGGSCLMQKTGIMELHEENNRKKQRILKVWCFLAIVMSCGFLLQCNDDGAVPRDNNGYFPLREGSSWKLRQKYYSNSWDGGYDTIQYSINGDTI